MRVTYLKAGASSVTTVTDGPFFGGTTGGKDLFKAGEVEENESAPAQPNQALALQLLERPGDDLSRCSYATGELIVSEPRIEDDAVVRGDPAAPCKVKRTRTRRPCTCRAETVSSTAAWQPLGGRGIE
jgi:hypothetical protein